MGFQNFVVSNKIHHLKPSNYSVWWALAYKTNTNTAMLTINRTWSIESRRQSSIIVCEVILGDSDKMHKHQNPLPYRKSIQIHNKLIQTFTDYSLDTLPLYTEAYLNRALFVEFFCLSWKKANPNQSYQLTTMIINLCICKKQDIKLRVGYSQLQYWLLSPSCRRQSQDLAQDLTKETPYYWQWFSG